MKNFMVYDIGGSAVKWSLINIEGRIIRSGLLNIADDIEVFLNILAEEVNEYKEEFNIEGIAVSAPGAVDSETGIITSKSAVPYLFGVNIKERLSEITGLKVEVENDANCAALGECWLGAAKDNDDSAFIVCGTGIGGAIVKNKSIHRGNHMHGGEFGFCIVESDVSNNKMLNWSEVGSTYALVKAIAGRKGIPVHEFNGKKAFELYDLGDAIAVEEINKFFTYMAIGIVNIQYIYDPEVIIIGGAISERNGLIEEVKKKVQYILKDNEYAKVIPNVKRCIHGNNANKLGALFNFLQKQNLI